MLLYWNNNDIADSTTNSYGVLACNADCAKSPKLEKVIDNTVGQG
jgi:hypothetical protein